MKKLFTVIIALMLCCMPSYAQIWEGSGGTAIDEGLQFGSGSGGGWIPEPLDPAMTHYTISFKDDNQTTSLFSPIELNENTVVDLSVFVPTRSEGYDFDHWEDGNGNTVTEVTMTSDQTVYATWSVHYHSITWQITDYSQDPVATYTSVDSHIAYGSVIVASSTPTVPSGYEFSGWNNPATMPDYDLVVNGAIEKTSIVYKLIETNYDSTKAATVNQRHVIEYDGSITNYSPISYLDGVVNMGSWESWINDHFTPVMLRSDGTVDYELSRTNQNYKADGVTPSDVANASYNGNAMLRIKKFYISCSTTTEGTGGDSHKVHTIRISDTKKDNTYTCWGFVDANGVEQDYAYYGLYTGYIDSNSKFRSIANVDLSQNTCRTVYSTIVTAAKANGNGWNISNIALENAIGLVMMMIYKDTNPMFVAQEYLDSSNNVITQDANVAKVTGTRTAEGGFPYTTQSQQPKSLWIENFWRIYDYSNLCAGMPWANGIGVMRDSSGNLTAYYKLKEPYDIAAQTDWKAMNNTNVYVYSSNSHETSSVVFYDNIMFPSDVGYGRQSVTQRVTNRAFGGGGIFSNAINYYTINELYPGRLGGLIKYSIYISPPMFFNYSFMGTRTGGYENGGARLTYLPQSN